MQKPSLKGSFALSRRGDCEQVYLMGVGTNQTVPKKFDIFPT